MRPAVAASCPESTTRGLGLRGSPHADGEVLSAESPLKRFRSAIEGHYGSLRRAVRRLGVPEFEVDDVLQETFLAFYRKLAAIHPGAERQFLLQTAFRVVQGRQRSFARRHEELESTFEQFTERRPNPEQEMSDREALEILDGILAAMPLELRMVFNLCEIEQVTVAEAASILEIPLGTASARLRRAREAFEKLARRVRTRGRQ